MSERIAIRVEGLGKRYTIGHQKSGDFRSSFGEKLKNLLNPSATSYEEFWALKDISFEVRQGEALGIIGRNGAGKSTLLKLLSRITEPTTGRFEINGRVSSLLEVGTGFHMELTGRENIYLNGTILGMKRREIKQKFDEIVAFSGVEQFIDTPVKHYSSGMKVRLAFSVAAHLEPEILIVDEVLAVGDAEFQKKCLGKMEDVAGDGRTVIFVSHDMAAVRNLCVKAQLFESGMLKMMADPSTVINKYLGNYYSTSNLSKLPRKGDLGKFLKFQSLSVVNKNLQEAEFITDNDDLVIKVVIENKNLLKEKFHMLIGINEIEGTRIFTVNALKFSLSGKLTETFILSINDIKLNEGTYNLTAQLRKLKRMPLDRIENISQFKVEKSHLDLELNRYGYFTPTKVTLHTENT